jgi:hypothetical protein
MKLARKFSASVALVVVLLLALTSVASMQAGPGTPSLVIGTGTDTGCTGQASVPLTLNGMGGSGTAGYSVLIGVPVGSVTFSDTCVGGPAFTGGGCTSFSCTVTDVGNGTTGLNVFQVDGVCLSGTTPAVTGDQLAATLTVLRSDAPLDSYVIDGLPTDGAGTFTQVFDPQAVTYNIPDGSITDGSVNWCPTAVTMSGFDAATDSPAPFTAAAWPLLTGALAVAAGGAYALLRRKS